MYTIYMFDIDSTDIRMKVPASTSTSTSTSRLENAGFMAHGVAWQQSWVNGVLPAGISL